MLYFKSLNSFLMENDFLIDQQKIGHDFINKPAIRGLLDLQMQTKVIPKIEANNNLVNVYEGKGLTIEDITFALKQQELKDNTIVDFLYKEYKKKCNLQNEEKLNRWLLNTEQTTSKKQFNMLQTKIIANENKN